MTPSPTQHFLVREVLAGAQRVLAHRTSKKATNYRFQLEQLVSVKVGPSVSLYDFRSSAGFLSSDELANVLLSDFKMDFDLLLLLSSLAKLISTGKVHGLLSLLPESPLSKFLF